MCLLGAQEMLETFGGVDARRRCEQVRAPLRVAARVLRRARSLALTPLSHPLGELHRFHFALFDRLSARRPAPVEAPNLCLRADCTLNIDRAHLCARADPTRFRSFAGTRSQFVRVLLLSLRFAQIRFCSLPTLRLAIGQLWHGRRSLTNSVELGWQPRGRLTLCALNGRIRLLDSLHRSHLFASG